MKSYTEAELLEDFARAGIGMPELQRLAGKALGISDIGSIEEANTIIGGSWPAQIRGAARYQCEACACFVSLAPSSQAMLAKRTLHVVCMSCARSNALEKKKADA
jgi:hypothetical protein